MTHVEVSWHPTYSINIVGMDGPTVFHLKRALEEYLESRSIDDESAATFERITEICDRISKTDDAD